MVFNGIFGSHLILQAEWLNDTLYCQFALQFILFLLPEMVGLGGQSQLYINKINRAVQIKYVFMCTNVILCAHTNALLSFRYHEIVISCDDAHAQSTEPSVFRFGRIVKTSLCVIIDFLFVSNWFLMLMARWHSAWRQYDFLI